MPRGSADLQPLRSGQRYRAAGCAQRARAASLRAAGTRYQASFAGRLAHAQRQRRYRARRQEVTHQGSPPPAPPVEVRTAPTVPESVPESVPSASGQCHLCHRALSPFVRQDFLHLPGSRLPPIRTESAPPWPCPLNTRRRSCATTTPSAGAIGTIAAQLGLHRDTVARVLAQAGLPRHGPVQRASAIDPYLPFLHETLAQFPRLTAARLWTTWCRARGYPGRPDHTSAT